MKRIIFTLAVVAASTIAFSQSDSSNYFFQKGLTEKQNGRRMESMKNFEKANKYNSNDKATVTELAAVYMDLRKYYEAKDMFKKLVDMGDGSAANYKQLLNLSFNLKQNDDVITYANKLKEVDP